MQRRGRRYADGGKGGINHVLRRQLEKRERAARRAVARLLAPHASFAAVVALLRWLQCQVGLASVVGGTNAHPLRLPPGVTAIQPSRHVTDRSQAAYGRAEVERYLESNPRLMRGVPGGPSPRLGTVEFLPDGQASARVNNASIGGHTDVLVCWVGLYGPFAVYYA